MASGLVKSRKGTRLTLFPPSVGDDPKPYPLRKPCAGCGASFGRILERGAQDTVRCASCDRWQYNAPRTETGKAVRTVKTTHDAITSKTRARVLMRATGKCELCLCRPEDTSSLHVGHIVSVKNGHDFGLSDDEINSAENLAAMCDQCNLGIGKDTIPLRLAIAIQMARLRNKCDS